MQRYFVENNQIHKPYISILDADFHHIKNVMRMKLQAEVLVCDQESNVYLCTIESFQNNSVQLLIKEEVLEDHEFYVDVTIAHGVVRKDKIEETLRRITELGARKYVNVQMERSVVKMKLVEEKHFQRTQKIIKEASEQSHRSRLMDFLGCISFKELLVMQKEYDLCLFAYEVEKNSSTLKTVLQNFSKRNILVVIGPEGGISPNEAQALQQAGFLPVGLGKRILRTETAPLFVMSALVYELEMREKNEG